MQSTTTLAIDSAVGFWIMLYGIRRKGGLDYALGPNGQAMRWVLAALSYAGMARLSIGWVRLICLLFFVGFVAWPNLAWYPMAALAWVRRVPRPPREPRWQREGAVDQQPDNPPRKAKDPTKPLGL